MSVLSSQPSRVEPTWEASEGLADWLSTREVSLVVSGYQSSRLFLVGSEGGRVTVETRRFVPCMGLARQGDALYVGTRQSIWRFRRGGDRSTFRPDRCWLTGDVKVHDVGVEEDGTPIFVNTLYNCLVRPVGTGVGFDVLWKPDFISEIVAEDRCHLNGLAMEGGRPRFVTSLSRSDEAGGWRARKATGGCLLDLQTGAAVLEGLSMPHSPRLHRGRLWLHQSGTGWLGWADPSAGRFEPVAFVPGILRGLAFHGNHAVAATSRIRYFGRQELPIEVELARRGTEGSCGVSVIDLDSGRVDHQLSFEGLEELYDVQVLPGTLRPRLEMG